MNSPRIYVEVRDASWGWNDGWKEGYERFGRPVGSGEFLRVVVRPDVLKNGWADRHNVER